MSTEAIKNADPDRAREVVARALVALSAAQSDPETLSRLEGMEHDVVAEWANRAGVDLKRLNTTSHARVLQIANKAATDLILSEGRGHVLPQLAGFGLSMRKREARLADNLAKNLHELGLSKTDVLRTVKDPDAQQIIEHDQKLEDNTDFIHLYVRLLNRRDFVESGGEPIWCLVVGTPHVTGYLNVYSAHKMLGRQLNIDPRTATPLDLLNELLRLYGAEVIINGIPSGKLVTYVAFSLRPIIEFARPDNHEMEASLGLMESSMPPYFRFLFIYCIDKTEYQNALRGFGAL